MSEATNVTVNVNGTGDSEFTGGLLGLIGWSIAGFLITTITAGICYPWALCMVYGLKINNTTISGRRLKFNGSAISLFGLWIEYVRNSV